MHSVVRGTGTPKDRDEVNRRDVCTVVYYESLKRELKTKPIYEFGAMKDYKLKLRNLHASHALCCARNWNT